MSNKKVYYYTERQLKGIEYAAKVVDFGVSLTVAVAFNELYTAHMMLRDRRDLYRKEVKHLANNAIEAAKFRRARMLSTMRSRKFFDAYSDRVIDLAENDVTVFRIGIKQVLDDNRVADAELISYVETARTLLDMAALHFTESIRHVTEEFFERDAKSGRPIVFDYARLFSEFNCKDVATAWGKVCTILYGREDNIDLNTGRNIAASRTLARKFADGVYVDECMKAAHEECPELWENNIIVKE